MTPYTSLPDMRAFYGAAYIDNAIAEVELSSVQAIVDGVNAMWDGKVLHMTGAPVPASVVAACKMFATTMATYRIFRDAPSDELVKQNDQALAFFTTIGQKNGPRFAADPVADDPATTEDESADAAGVAVGFNARQLSYKQLTW